MINSKEKFLIDVTQFSENDIVKEKIESFLDFHNIRASIKVLCKSEFLGIRELSSEQGSQRMLYLLNSLQHSTDYNISCVLSFDGSYYLLDSDISYEDKNLVDAYFEKIKV